MNPKEEKYLNFIKSSFVAISKKNNGTITCYNWKNGECVDLYDKSHPAYRLFDNEQIPNNFDFSAEQLQDLKWLEENGFILSPKGSDIIPRNTPPDFFQLILLPAGEACNLRCVYCYEAHEDTQRMNEEHVKRIVDLCKKQSLPLRIEFFGGEPLLNIGFIQNLSTSLQENGIPYGASITTNGTLLNENVITELYSYNIKSYQITIDGIEELHNSLRPYYNNLKSSHKLVRAALEALQKSKYSDLKIILRSNVNESSTKSRFLREFFNDIQALIPPQDTRFSFLFRPIGDYASANNRFAAKVNTICNHSKVNDVIATIEDLFESVGYRLVDPQMMVKCGGFSCYAGNKNSFVISPDFSLKKCTVALSDPLNNVGSLEENGELSLNSNYSKWIKDFSDYECSKCFFYRTCQGNSCALSNIKTNSKNCPPIKKLRTRYEEKIIKSIEQMEE